MCVASINGGLGPLPSLVRILAQVRAGHCKDGQRNAKENWTHSFALHHVSAPHPKSSISPSLQLAGDLYSWEQRGEASEEREAAEMEAGCADPGPRVQVRGKGPPCRPSLATCGQGGAVREREVEEASTMSLAIPQQYSFSKNLSASSVGGIGPG